MEPTSTISVTKVPPHDIEAEKCVVGSILIDKNAIVKIADFIHTDDFYYDPHAIVFGAMLELFNRRSPIDLLTIASLLRDKKKLEEIGGESYLAALTAGVPTASHIVQYALIVKHKATLRRLLEAGDEITGLGYNETDALEEILEQAEKTLFSVSQTFIKDRFIHIKEILNQTYEKIAELHDAEEKDKYRGIPLGYASLDKKLSGLQAADLIIIAARPSMGKTALALNIAQNIAQLGKSVGIISLEMSKEQLVERLFCSLLEVDSWKLRTGQLEEDDFERIGGVMDSLDKAKIYIDDSVGNTIVELRAKTRRLQMEHGLDLLIIDYLQLMTVDRKYSISVTNRVQEISEISRALKGLSRELHIPIIALSQLSRAVELRTDKRPQLSDLRESGAIEQDADVVLMMYREDYYDELSDRPGMTDIFIRKHRNGPTGHIELRFEKSRMRFYELDEQHQYQPEVKQLMRST